MEDILELQIDETLHGNISDLTSTTSHDLVYNAIKIIIKDMKNKNNGVVNELTFLINESKTTIATLEGLGISTPEVSNVSCLLFGYVLSCNEMNDCFWSTKICRI